MREANQFEWPFLDPCIYLHVVDVYGKYRYIPYMDPMSDDFRSLQNGREVCGRNQDGQPRKNSVEFGNKCPNQRSHMEKHYASSNRQVG